MPASTLTLYKDHASLHSAGRALERRAKGKADVQGLLHLATQIVFSDSLRLNGYETRHVSGRSDQVLNALIDLGVPSSLIAYSDETPSEYADCCVNAAELLAEDIPHRSIEGLKDHSAVRPEISKKQSSREAALTELLNEGHPGAHQMFGAPHDAMGAAGYMFTEVQALWDALTDPKSLSPPRGRGQQLWSESQVRELIMISRFYLNDALARFHQGLYSPAVERAKMVRQQADESLDLLSRILPEDTSAGEFAFLGAPRVVRALLLASKGDPKGIIETAREFRHQAAPLRVWLGKRGEEIRRDPGGAKRSLKLHVETTKLAAALDYQINSGQTGPLDELQVNVNIPSGVGAQMSSRKFRKWWYSKKRRKLLTVLTSASLIDKRGERSFGAAYKKLVRNCVRQR